MALAPPEFAVSPADGTIAFVSDNQLFLLDSDGENRRLVTDDRQVDMETEDSYFDGLIRNPFLSPDGRTLAYAFDGLHLYNLASDEDEHVLANLGNLLGQHFVFAKENYVPGPWSPDGGKLLIIMSYFEGSTLAVMNPGAEDPFIRFWSDGPMCCLFNWAADGGSVLVANPHYTGDIPGLTKGMRSGIWRRDRDAQVLRSSHGQPRPRVRWRGQDSPADERPLDFGAGSSAEPLCASRGNCRTNDRQNFMETLDTERLICATACPNKAGG